MTPPEIEAIVLATLERWRGIRMTQQVKAAIAREIAHRVGMEIVQAREVVA